MIGLFSENSRKIMSLVGAVIFVSVVFAYLNSKYGIYYLSNDDTGIMKTYSGYATATGICVGIVTGIFIFFRTLKNRF